MAWSEETFWGGRPNHMNLVPKVLPTVLDARKQLELGKPAPGRRFPNGAQNRSREKSHHLAFRSDRKRRTTWHTIPGHVRHSLRNRRIHAAADCRARARRSAPVSRSFFLANSVNRYSDFVHRKPIYKLPTPSQYCRGNERGSCDSKAKFRTGAEIFQRAVDSVC